MNLRRIAALCFLCLPFMAAHGAEARNAEMLLSPTRVVLEGTSRFATVTVRNTGSATGRYKIDIVDAHMGENGAIKLRDDGGKEEFSAMDMLSLSPRNITLKPDESQTVRILVKAKSDMPDGEYRSHLQVKITESDLDPDGNRPSPEGANIVLKPKMTTVIPVIIRKGKTDYKVSIEDASVGIGGGDGKQIPNVKVVFGFSGNRSVLGDVKVTHVSPDGKDTQLSFFRGIAIYRGVARREQTVALDVPDGVDISKGRLRIAFMSQENEGSQVLAEKETPL